MKKALIGLALAVVVAGGIAFMLYYPPNPTGQATGSAVKPRQADGVQQALWQQLSRHEGTYLGAYADYFQNTPDEPMELLNAFNEVAYNVTGFGGLWRKTVPDKYFGCQQNEHLPICKKFHQMKQTFSRWDEFQKEMESIGSNREAKRFLKKHGEEMRKYLETYVPADESFSAVQATPFFADNLAGSM